jgi:hypothetical protein
MTSMLEDQGHSVGDIFNACANAIHAGSTDANPERWEVTQAMLEREITKAKKAKAEHSGGSVRSGAGGL